MIEHHALVVALVGEVDVEEVELGGVDQLPLLVLGVVVHLGVVEHLAVLPPRGGHGRVAAAGGHAAQSHVVAAQCHARLGVGGDVRLGEVVCSAVGEERRNETRT